MSIKRSEIRIGAARDEDRAPSHDGEYLAVYYAAGGGGDYIIEDNAGGVTTSRTIERLRNEVPVCSHEIGRWQAEAEAIVAEDAGEDWDPERMGLASRVLAAEFGWTH